jgi:hypothetical protein
MNKADRGRIQYLGDYTCKRIRELKTEDHWENHREIQILLDTLLCMKHVKLISAYNIFEGVTVI